MKHDHSGEGVRLGGAFPQGGSSRAVSVLIALVLIAGALWAGATFARRMRGQASSQNQLIPDTPISPEAKRYVHEHYGIPDDNDKLIVPEDKYLRWPLPPGEEKYADVKGEDIKKTELEIVGISEKSRTDGNQEWGRIAGTEYDHMATDWVSARFKALGLEVHQQEQTLPAEWRALSWQANVDINGKNFPLKTANPIDNSVGTPNGPVEGDAVWLGLGFAADFKGRDLHGKAALVYSWPTPSGEDETALWSGVLKRAQDAGASMIVYVLGYPGNATNIAPVLSSPSVPTICISWDEGTAIRQAMEKGQTAKIHLKMDTQVVSGYKTTTTWGVLPGQSDEKILVLAHHDAYFDGAVDNASGMAMLQYIAARYAAIPQSQRKRTMVFLDTPIHHIEVLRESSHIGDEWIKEHFSELFPKTAMIINCEHISQTQFYNMGAGFMSSNTMDARPWFADGSDDFKKVVADSLREFGVATYTVREDRPGGELSQLFTLAPSFHVIGRRFYHTTDDIPDWTPAAGMESVARAYLKIIDTTNGMSLAAIKGNFQSVLPTGGIAGGAAPGNPQAIQEQGKNGPLGIPNDRDQLFVPEDKYLRWPLPPGEEKYASVKGEDIKKIQLEAIAIAEQSRKDGNQLWGRIVGTKYDHMSADWAQARFKKLGMEVHREEQNLPPRWNALSWTVDMMSGGKTVSLKTAMPVQNSVGTPNGPLEAEAVWVDMGFASDFQGRDLKGKAAVIYDWPTPGGQDSSALWNGAITRAQDAGASFIVIVLGFPGDGTNIPPLQVVPNVPGFVISHDEGATLRQAIEQGENPKIRLNMNVKMEEGLKTETTWAVLPGQTDEKILFVAHHDAYFDGALDNSSGMALLQYIAAHYAAMPKEQRKRTLVFLDTPSHHLAAKGLGAQWISERFYDLFPKTAFIVNCEHISQTQFYYLGAGLMSSNTVTARPYYVNGSEAFQKLVLDSLQEFGVAHYTLPEEVPGGELGAGPFYTKAPSFHVIDRDFYHTTLDTPDWTPASGMEAVARAYLKIIDTANGWDLGAIKGTFRDDSDRGN